LKGDPIDNLLNQAVSFTFTADTSKPIEYAMFLKSYSQDQTGLRNDHSQLGVGEFLLIACHDCMNLFLLQC